MKLKIKLLNIILFFLVFCFGIGTALGIVSDDKKGRREWLENFNKLWSGMND